ncbi:MAG: toprim domain-containing protein, partial [Caulobacteraceae bacterium]
MAKSGPAKVTVVVAEKPELAKAIAAALGSGSRGDGFIDCGDHLVTWALGHMLELKPPAETRWTLASLPLQLAPYDMQPVGDKRTQLKTIRSLLSRANSVIHAGDPDEEGQLIIDEILEWAEWRGPVRRVLINDNNLAIVKRALANAKDNSEYLGMSCAARYRSIGDWVYGL